MDVSQTAGRARCFDESCELRSRVLDSGQSRPPKHNHIVSRRPRVRIVNGLDHIAVASGAERVEVDVAVPVQPLDDLVVQHLTDGDDRSLGRFGLRHVRGDSRGGTEGGLDRPGNLVSELAVGVASGHENGADGLPVSHQWGVDVHGLQNRQGIGAYPHAQQFPQCGWLYRAVGLDLVHCWVGALPFADASDGLETKRFEDDRIDLVGGPLLRSTRGIGHAEGGLERAVAIAVSCDPVSGGVIHVVSLEDPHLVDLARSVPGQRKTPLSRRMHGEHKGQCGIAIDCGAQCVAMRGGVAGQFRQGRQVEPCRGRASRFRCLGSRATRPQHGEDRNGQ